MGRKDTESTDVSEEDSETEMLVFGPVHIPCSGTTTTFIKSGVVCRINRAKNSRYPIITVEVDLKRWRQIPAGSDEEQPVVDDTAESYCLECTCGSGARMHYFSYAQGCRVCQSCGGTVE